MEQITYTNISNKEIGSSVRAKINALGNSVASMSGEVSTLINDIQEAITDYETRISELEIVPSLLTVGTTINLSPQSVSTTPSKLTYATGAFFSCGNKFTFDVPNQRIAISSQSTAIIGGSIVLTGTINNIIDVSLYINGSPTGNMISLTIPSSGKPVTFSYYGAMQLYQNDYVEVYISSTGSSATVLNSSVVLEEKKC